MINSLFDVRVFSFGLLCGVLGYCIAPICLAKVVQFLSWVSGKSRLKKIQADLRLLVAQVRELQYSGPHMELSEKIDSLSHMLEQLPHKRSRKRTKKSTPKTYVNGAGSSSNQPTKN